MDNTQHERGELSIPSFASDRCRAMTTKLITTLGEILPSDDQALEDRALACFVVACGELAVMRGTEHRDAVVEQLTVVARKLVKANAESPKSKPMQNPAPNPAQGLAQGLMRGLFGSAAGAGGTVADEAPGQITPKKSPTLQPAQRPILDIIVDPPEIPVPDRQQQAALDDGSGGETARREGAYNEVTRSETAKVEAVHEGSVGGQTVARRAEPAELVERETLQADVAKSKPIEDEAIKDEPVKLEAPQSESEQAKDDGVHKGTIQSGNVEATAKIEVLHPEAAEEGRQDEDGAKDAAASDAVLAKIETLAGLSLDELEARIKQEMAELASHQ
jgi:hypothetical protein